MYKRMKRGSIVLLVSLLLPLGFSLPAYASKGSNTDTVSIESGSHESSATATAAAATPAETEHSTTTDDSNKPEAEKPETEAEIEHGSELKKEAASTNERHSVELLADAKKLVKEHTKEERLKNCNAKQKNIDTKLLKLQNNAKRHLAVMDSVLTKLKAANITSAEFDTLVANAVTAKLTATASVKALGDLTSTIDCAKDTAASDIAHFKVAADQARTGLKAYRSSLKAVLSFIETKVGE